MKPNIGQGDSGKSFLFGTGEKFSKDSAQFEALGKLDELNSFVGYANALSTNDDMNKLLEQIQNDIFEAQANLGVEKNYKQTKNIPKFSKEKVKFLENQIFKFEKNLPKLENFIFPGGTEYAAAMHICRTVSRTVERRIVSMRQEYDVNENVQAYINRLSDLFFILARYINYKENNSPTGGEKKWPLR